MSTLRSRIGQHLTDVMNLPKPMQAAALGTDMSGLIASLTAIASDYANEQVAAVKAETQIEWGVRYPSGSVDNYRDDEAGARRYALTTSALRPDLPTLVVRKAVTPWEVAQ